MQVSGAGCAAVGLWSEWLEQYRWPLVYREGDSISAMLYRQQKSMKTRLEYAETGFQ
jgi:hypothetical protein